MESILIVADMEGCIGLNNTNYASECFTLMQKEVECIIVHLLNSGKYNISVLDCHNSGENLLPLHEKYKDVKFIQHIWSFDRRIKYDIALFTGFHAKGGANGFYSHTFRDDILHIKLGTKVVGELELLINWLSYYGTPTLFVSGDSAAVEEVEHLNCVKFCAKSANLNNDNSEYLYKELIKNIDKALQLDRYQPKYIKQPIELKFINSDLLDYLPRYDYQIKDESIFFENTIQLLESLYEMSFIINAVNSIIFIKVSRIINKLRESYTLDDMKKINDPEIDKILNMSSKQRITKQQRDYLINKFNLKL